MQNITATDVDKLSDSTLGKLADCIDGRQDRAAALGLRPDALDAIQRESNKRTLAVLNQVWATTSLRIEGLRARLAELDDDDDDTRDAIEHECERAVDGLPAIERELSRLTRT